VPDETNGVSNAVSCYKEATQFNVSLLRHSLQVFDKICGMAMKSVFFPDDIN